MSSAPSPLRSISVSGDTLLARLVAELLAKRLGPYGCAVSLGECGGGEAGTQFLSPQSLQALAAGGLPPDRLVAAGGKLRFGWELHGTSVMLGPYGVARGGAEFHHHLHRIEGTLTHDMLAAFNPGHVTAQHWPAAKLMQSPPAPFGVAIAADALGQCLGTARKGEAPASADFSIEVTGAEPSLWDGDRITVPATRAIPEFAVDGCVRTVERFVGLLPGAGDSSASQREFNRLSAAQAGREADFAGLLTGENDRPALDRKISVFKACGRIPLEDYEVFAPHQWLGALLQAGHVPRDYDRLADRVPLAETEQWIAGLRVRMEQLAKAGVA